MGAKSTGLLRRPHWAAALAFVSLISVQPLVSLAQSAGPVNLRCENLINPLGMDAPRPALSWQLRDPALGARQTAYQVQVASSLEKLSKADVWDSGRVVSGESRNMLYAGPAFAASTRYFWRVTVWGANGKAYP